jgi:Protein of unknown function (DUF3048) N-terminal domain/Protein of unknown function (DUF3048) C-terminal domain
MHGKLRVFLLGSAGALVVLALVVFLVGGGGDAPSPTSPGASSSAPATTEPPPASCPLSGVDPEGEVPVRPALGVKVENLPAARPQTGLSWADVVYEEPVEGGITRFIAVYQCQDAEKIEPVRSARLSDPDILVQYGEAILAYSGAAPQVEDVIGASGLTTLTEASAPEAFHRDPDREAPHNLYTDTVSLYEAAGSSAGAPEPIFTFAADPPAGGTPTSSVTVPMTFAETIEWRWDASDGRWLRYDEGEPHVLSNGTQISAENVVVQMVDIEQTYVVDPASGARSPKAVSIGQGTVYVLRDGHRYQGTWSRPTLSDVMVYALDDGTVIPLGPGATWIELTAKGSAVDFAA